jgi:hypothetical protein
MQERKKSALFMCIAISVSLSRAIDIPFIICVQMKETEWKKKKKKLHDKLLFSISLLNFISMRLQNRILLTKLST